MVHICICRLEYHQRADVLREQQREFFIQQQLDAIAKKFEAPLPLSLPDKQNKEHALERKKAEVTFAVVGDEPATTATKPNSHHGKVRRRSLLSLLQCSTGVINIHTVRLYFCPGQAGPGPAGEAGGQEELPSRNSDCFE